MNFIPCAMVDSLEIRVSSTRDRRETLVKHRMSTCNSLFVLSPPAARKLGGILSFSLSRLVGKRIYHYDSCQCFHTEERERKELEKPRLCTRLMLEVSFKSPVFSCQVSVTGLAGSVVCDQYWTNNSVLSHRGNSSICPT
jgi:hypothetical protein